MFCVFLCVCVTGLGECGDWIAFGLHLEYRYNTFAILLLIEGGGGAHFAVALIGQIVALLQLDHIGTVLVAMMIFAMLSMRVHNYRLRPLGQLGHLLQIGSALIKFVLGVRVRGS